MLHLRPTHQFTKSFRDILRRIPGLVVGRGRSAPAPPQVPFVIRLGAAGPLRLDAEREDLSLAIKAILGALMKYADESANSRFHQKMFPHSSAQPAARPRLYCQLASGFDQMAALAALSLGYRLHVVLPGNRAAFRHDIKRNVIDNSLTSIVQDSQSKPALFGGIPSLSMETGAAERESRTALDAVSQFEQLIEVADRVLELDRDDASSDFSEFSLNDYAQAGSVILDHSDLVLVAIYEDEKPPFTFGGTRWIEERAEGKDLTIICVPVERPFDALLIWTVNGRREWRRLFEAGFREVDPLLFAAVLDDQLLGPDFDPVETRFGWLEQRMVAQLDPEYNAKEWDRRWMLPYSDALARHDLGRSLAQIDSDLKPAKVWADHRASAMAELVRGSFIISAWLGIVAVGGALTRVLVPSFGETGEGIEIICLGMILGFVWRSRRCDWRSQWLSLRQLERYLEQAAWMLLLGRGRIYATPAHLSQFQTNDVAKWTNAYFRAVIRNSSFPNACLAPDYLKTVHALTLQNLVVAQISYLQGEAPFQLKSDEFLERWTYICVFTALTATFMYLLACRFPMFGGLFVALTDQYPVLAKMKLSLDSVGLIVAVLAALLTTTASALSAMRHHGEYAQIAARYEGACDELQEIRSQLAQRLPDRRPDFSPRPPRSAYLALIIERATEVLIQEVQGWRAILQKKEIEPT